MLVLTRKPGEKIVIGDRIEVQVVRVRGGRVSLAITAPRETLVARGELPGDKYSAFARRAIDAGRIAEARDQLDAEENR